MLEDQRVEKVVVDAAIDHVYALQAESGAHVDEVVVDDQIAAFDKFDAHLACEISVFEIGGVVRHRA